MATRKWSELKDRMAPERRARVDAAVRQELHAMKIKVSEKLKQKSKDMILKPWMYWLLAGMYAVFMGASIYKQFWLPTIIGIIGIIVMAICAIDAKRYWKENNHD